MRTAWFVLNLLKVALHVAGGFYLPPSFPPTYSSSLAAALRVGVKREPPPSHATAAKPTATATGRAKRALSRYLSLLRLGLRMGVELPWVVRREFVAPPPEANIFKPRPLTGRKTVGYHLAAMDVERVRAVKVRVRREPWLGVLGKPVCVWCCWY